MAQWSENNNQTYWDVVGEFWECFGQPFQNALEPKLARDSAWVTESSSTQW